LQEEALPLVEADRDRLMQVLGNLLSNAVSVTPAGGEIAVGAETDHHEVTFFVRDTGPGITSEEQAHLFERFRRGKKAGYRSTGLGLYIASAIIKAHGGRLWVESELGQGSTFFFTISLALGQP
jgi:signal transduction histidine kinase